MTKQASRYLVYLGVSLGVSGCSWLLTPYSPTQTITQKQPTSPQQPPPTTHREKPTAEEQFETNTDLVAIPAFGGQWMSAPLGMSLKDLGRPHNASFQRLQGPGGASLFPKAEPPNPPSKT